MSEYKLSPRLALAASYIEKGESVADIGTDHAFIPVYLALSGISKKIIASDVKDGPVKKAEAYINHYPTAKNKITVVKCDGLDNIEPCNKIIIAGMGGETIIKILEKSNNFRKSRFILQPMTKPELLRRFLYENGYFLIDETAVVDDNKIYTVMYAEISGIKQVHDEKDCLFSVPLQNKNDIITNIYLEKILLRIEKAIKGKKNATGYNGEKLKEEVIYDFLKIYRKEDRK